MEVRLLGALEVTDDSGTQVALAGAKLRALLALLALRPGRVVPADRLVDDLWGEAAGESARNSLQVMVSRLRRTLPNDVVATRAPGYALDVPEESVDVSCFRQLSAQGRIALAAGDARAAAGLFRDALRLWRGEALADFAYEDFARPEIEQLTDERLAVFEERVDADLALGRHADLVPELEAAVKAAPYRERARGQLMLALYRSGRQADALRHFQEARKALSEGLGLEPGPDLTSLEAAILQHSPELVPPAVPSPAVPSPLGRHQHSAPPGGQSETPLEGTVAARVLVGRDQQLAQLRAVLARAEAGSRSVVLVAGESGIGKTELVRAATRGRRLLAWGTCVDDAAAGALWPWSRALEQLGRAVGVEQARLLAGPDVTVLATIARSFGQARARAGTARDRLILLDAVCRWLEALATTATVVVVLDDLQWADGSTLSLLDLVARSPQPAALCIIGCYRPGELNGPARAQLPRLSTAAEHVELTGLDRGAVETLVEGFSTVQSEAIDEIYRRAGGHPVFTRELALVWGNGGATRIPSAVRDAIELRIRRLPSRAQEVLEVGALAGNIVHVSVVAAVLGISTADVEAACGAAMTAGMLTGTQDGPRFAHDLYRETLGALVDPTRRPALHQAIGAVLEAQHLRGAPANPADVARHFIAAVPVDGGERAARWALAAAAADRASFAFAEAAGQLRRWRDAVAEAGPDIDDELRLEMLSAEADALARAGMPDDARNLLGVARYLATRTGNWARLGEIALAVAQLGAVTFARRDEVIGELEEALAAVSGRDTALEAQLAARLARELQHSVVDDRPRARPLSEHALKLGREGGDPATLVACLFAHHDVLWTPGGAAARADVAREIVATAERAGDSEHRAEGLLLLANALVEQASPAFRPALEQYFNQLEKLGQPRYRYMVECRRIFLALLEGDLDEAAARIEPAAHLGHRIHEPDTDNVRMGQRQELCLARGRTDELAAFAQEAIKHWTQAPVLANALAAGFLARAGDLGGAKRHMAAVADLGTWRADRSYMWSALVRELSVAAVAVHDEALCSELLADLVPVAGTCGSVRLSSRSPAVTLTLPHCSPLRWAGTVGPFSSRPGRPTSVSERKPGWMVSTSRRLTVWSTRARRPPRWKHQSSRRTSVSLQAERADGDWARPGGLAPRWLMQPGPN